MVNKILFFTILSLGFTTSAKEKTFEFKSPKKQTQVLELFTSEGCSSCPPAERWFRQFTSHPETFKTVFPMSFHVTYWDNLGWKDPFAEIANTKKQRDYSSSWEKPRVYTPGFVLNGKEWRGYFDSKKLGPQLGPEVGVLSVKGSIKKDIEIQYLPRQKTKNEFIAGVALLGFDLSTNVKAGENSGRRLTHQFVVLKWLKLKLKRQGDNHKIKISWPFQLDKYKTNKFALVTWIQDPKAVQPIQATGGRLSQL